MLQTAWRRTYYNELRERAHAEKEIQGLWQVRRPPGSARRHLVAPALLKGSTARNGDGGVQALVRRVTQQRALWALSPAFDMWQLDRTEGRCAPHDRVTSRMPVELTAVLLSDRLVRRRSGPYRVRARLARPEREPPFVVPRAEDGGFRGWEQGAPLCVDPLLDPLLAGILKLTLEPCDAGLYGDTASNAQGVGSGSGDVDEDSTAEALDAARDELLVRVMGPACAASFHEPFWPRGSPAGLRTGLSRGLVPAHVPVPPAAAPRRRCVRQRRRRGGAGGRRRRGHVAYRAWRGGPVPLQVPARDAVPADRGHAAHRQAQDLLQRGSRGLRRLWHREACQCVGAAPAPTPRRSCVQAAH